MHYKYGYEPFYITITLRKSKDYKEELGHVFWIMVEIIQW